MNQNRTVALYGNKQELSTFADRIRELLPGGNKLSGQQAMALAQVSAIHGLDPFNGEVWHLPQGIQIGIKGLRKKARQQIGDKGNFWATFREIVDPEERKRLMIDGGCLAFECRLFDTQTLQAFSDTIKTLRGAEVPIDAIMRIVGDKPYTSGIGVFKPGERSMMLPAQCAMKRAEADAIKRRFDVPFEVSEEELPASPATQYVDGRVVDADTGEIHGDASNGKHAAAELFGTAEPIPAVEVQRTAAPEQSPSQSTREELIEAYRQMAPKAEFYNIKFERVLRGDSDAELTRKVKALSDALKAKQFEGAEPAYSAGK